jgi:hypothetical protein
VSVKDFIVKNGLQVKGAITADSDVVIRGNIQVSGTITGDGSGLSGVTSYVKANFDSDFATKTTTDLAEGTNLYYTDARVDSNISNNGISLNTEVYAKFGDSGELQIGRFGANNFITGSAGILYAEVPNFSVVRYGNFANMIVALGDSSVALYHDGNKKIETIATGVDITGSLVADSASITGALQAGTLSGQYLGFDSDFGVKTTDDLTEGGTNLYYTTARTDSDFDARLALKTTDDLTEGSTNLYYDSATTVTVARNSVSITDVSGNGSLTYNAGTGVITSNISAGTGVSITDGQISIGQAVATTSDVTFAKITGDSAVLDQINFNTAYAGEEHIPFVEGALWYDNYHKTLNYWADDSNVIHEIGTEEHQKVYNNTGSLIEKGKPLYFSGSYNPGGGVQPVPTVDLADATDVNAYNSQGLAAGNIANNSYGYIAISGRIDGLNTSGLAAGDNFFVGLTPGAIQNSSPVYPNYPMCLGWVVVSDSSDGVLIIGQQNHSVNSFRVRTSAHIGTNLIVDGDLLVNGTQTITSTANVSIGGSIQYLNAGNTIGETNTTFVGSGLDDAFFAGHYSGDSSSKSFYVKIDATGTPDTFEWGHDSAVGAIATGIAIIGAEQILDSDYGISIDFGSTTGHTVGDVWAGTATASDVDTGIFSNRNTGDAGSGYTHLGFFFDVSTNKWRLLDAYDPEPENPINLAEPTLSYGDLVVNQIEGNLVGNVTGTVNSIANFTTDNLTEGSINLYYDSAAVVTASRNAMVAGTGITYTASTGTIATNDGTIVHDNLSGFVANEHIDHSTVSISAGTGLTGGGTIAASRTLAIDSSGLAAYFSKVIVHDNTNGFVSNEHIDHSTVSIVAGDGLTGGGNITTSRTISIGAGTGITVSADAISTNDAAIIHDNLSGFVANEHIDHTTVSISAGTGLTGGGDITATRTLSIANTGVSAATYGDSSTIPRITVNAQGQITAVVGASVNIPAGYDKTNFDSDFATKTTTNLTEGTNLYHTAARARSAISITDAGGDGSLAYNSGTGVITYTGPSAAEVRAHISAGTGISFTSGVIANTGVLSVNSVTGAVTAANLLTAINSVDGAGSGLDADLLDGQQGSYYRIDVYNAAGTLLN